MGTMVVSPTTCDFVVHVKKRWVLMLEILPLPRPQQLRLVCFKQDARDGLHHMFSYHLSMLELVYNAYIIPP